MPDESTGFTDEPMPGMPEPAPEPPSVLALAARWEAESQEMREQSVRDGLHPALAGAHREANVLAKCAADLRAAIGNPGPRSADDMYRSAYFRVQEILDDALGTEDEDGAGQGIAADVALLAARCKAAEAAVMELRGVTALPGMPDTEL